MGETRDSHEWLYVSEKGEHVNYNGQVHTCVMGGYQQDYLLEILNEALKWNRCCGIIAVVT